MTQDTPSPSGLKNSPYLDNPPLTTREKEVLKVAREGLIAGRKDRDPYATSQLFEDKLERIIDILEGGAS